MYPITQSSVHQIVPQVGPSRRQITEAFIPACQVHQVLRVHLLTRAQVVLVITILVTEEAVDITVEEDMAGVVGMEEEVVMVVEATMGEVIQTTEVVEEDTDQRLVEVAEEEVLQRNQLRPLTRRRLEASCPDFAESYPTVVEVLKAMQEEAVVSEIEGVSEEEAAALEASIWTIYWEEEAALEAQADLDSTWTIYLEAEEAVRAVAEVAWAHWVDF